MITDAHLHEAAYNAMQAEYYGLMEIREAAPNPMFGPLETWLTRFVHPPGKEKWTCPACGKKRGQRWFWTQLIPFQAGDMTDFGITFGQMLDPLTAVCDAHVLSPWHLCENAAVRDRQA